MKNLFGIFTALIAGFLSIQLVSAQKSVIEYKDLQIKQHEAQDSEEYLLGKSIMFYEPVTKAEKLFNLEGIEFGQPYVVKAVSSYYSLGIPHVDIVVVKRDFKGDKGIHIKCRNGESTNKKPGIDDIPAYFYSPIGDLKDRYIGKTITENDKQFTISDISVSKRKGAVSFVYTTIDGESFEEPVNEALSYAYYDTLINVEKPDNDVIIPGIITPLEVGTNARFLYEDNIISIHIYHNDSEFHFYITNKAEGTIKLIWDDAAYVDVLGRTSKVVHSGVKYKEREKAQMPSIIVKGSTLDDAAIPIDNIFYDEEIGWYTKPMYDLLKEGDIALLLPIQIKGVNNEYIFVFNRKVIRRHPELYY